MMRLSGLGSCLAPGNLNLPPAAFQFYWRVSLFFPILLFFVVSGFQHAYMRSIKPIPAFGFPSKGLISSLAPLVQSHFDVYF